MNTQLSKTVEDRIDEATGGNLAWREAENALYDAFRKVGALDPALEKELTGAWVDILAVTQQIVWMDGWQCGRNPELLATFVAEGVTR